MLLDQHSTSRTLLPISIFAPLYHAISYNRIFGLYTATKFDFSASHKLNIIPTVNLCRFSIYSKKAPSHIDQTVRIQLDWELLHAQSLIRCTQYVIRIMNLYYIRIHLDTGNQQPFYFHQYIFPFFPASLLSIPYPTDPPHPVLAIFTAIISSAISTGRITLKIPV